MRTKMKKKKINIKNNEKDKIDLKTKRNTSEEPLLSSLKIDTLIQNELKTLNKPVLSYMNELISSETNEIIFVYTDVIKPRYVGSKKNKCIKIFSTSSLKNYINFNRIDYFPIESVNINDIPIKILNDE